MLKEVINKEWESVSILLTGSVCTSKHQPPKIKKIIINYKYKNSKNIFYNFKHEILFSLEMIYRYYPKHKNESTISKTTQVHLQPSNTHATTHEQTGK